MAATRWSRAVETVAALWLAAMVFYYSDAGAGILAILLFFYGGALLGLVVGVRLLIRRSGLAALGMLLAGIAVASWPAPSGPLFRLRFALSEHALETRARALAGTTFQSTQPEWIGLFRVERITTHEGQARFITTPCGVVDSCGVVYAPSGTPSRYMEDQFTPLHGAWWHVFEGF